MTVVVVSVELHRMYTSTQKEYKTPEMVGLLAMTTLAASDFATDISFLIQAGLSYSQACESHLPSQTCEGIGMKAFWIAIMGLANLVLLFIISWVGTVWLVGPRKLWELLTAWEGHLDSSRSRLSKVLWLVFIFMPTRVLTVIMMGFDLEVLKILPWDHNIVEELNQKLIQEDREVSRMISQSELERSMSRGRSRRTSIINKLSSDRWEGFPSPSLAHLARHLCAFEDCWQLVLQILWFVWFQHDEGVVQGALINVLSLVFTLMHLIVKCLSPIYFQVMYKKGASSKRDGDGEAGEPLGQDSSLDLLHSIFPPVVAKDLIARRRKGTLSISKSSLKTLSSSKIGKIVARLHSGVTILFTDIVGFTEMSQSCPPYEVMHFLHRLFVQFDKLIDASGSQLWKVETVGDAFMVASGLNWDTSEESDTSTEEEVSSKAVSYKLSRKVSFTSGRCNSQVTCIDRGGSSKKWGNAVAAVKFGRDALQKASTLYLPNGEICEIRVGLHTGDVCSGVVGWRMPRYCLFGDTVNTASRMESTGMPGRMQISKCSALVPCIVLPLFPLLLQALDSA